MMIRGVKFVSIPVTDQEQGACLLHREAGIPRSHRPAVQRRAALDRVGDPWRRHAARALPRGRRPRARQPDEHGAVDRRRRGDGARAEAKGVAFSQDPKREPWGTFCTFKDPDGNSFVLGTR